jgi:hypothetical protein
MSDCSTLIQSVREAVIAGDVSWALLCLDDLGGLGHRCPVDALVRLALAEAVVDAAREVIDRNGVEIHTKKLAAALFAYDEIV